MVLKNGVLELGVMDLKPTWRDIPRLKEITADMLGKKAREALAEVGFAFFTPIPGSWIGLVAVMADEREEVTFAGERDFCIDEIQKDAA